MTKKGSLDIQLIIVTIVLLVFGGIILYSSSYYSSLTNEGSPYVVFFKFLKYTTLSLLVCFVTATLNYHVYKKLYWFIGFVGIALLIIVLIIGTERNNAVRWIYIFGISVQPSEVAKLTGIITLSAYLSKFKPMLSWNRVLPAMAFVLITCGLISRGDFSIAGVVGVILLAVVYVAGMKYSQLFIFGLILVILAGGILLSSPWRLDRITAIINQEETGDGYQSNRSQVAIGSGGLTGKGINRSVQNKLHLPEPYNDFIAATIGEELGFIGLSSFVFLYAFFVYRLGFITLHAPNRFGTLLGAGITTMFGVQFVLNLLVTLAILPSTGIPIPLISYGGSGMIISMASIGIMLNISRHINLGEAQ